MRRKSPFISQLRSPGDSRPRGDRLFADTARDRAHSGGERREVEAAVVDIRLHDPQSFLDALDRRAALTHLRVKDPDAELQKNPDELRLVVDALEKELLEEIARLEELSFIEERHCATEARVVDDF